MKNFFILLIVATALLSFSCNKYCHCDQYIDGEKDKDYKGNFVKESSSGCDTFLVEPYEKDGKTYEVKCK